MSDPRDLLRRARAVARDEGFGSVLTKASRRLRPGAPAGVRVERFPENERFPFYAMIDADAEDLADNRAAVTAWNDAALPREITSATWLLPHFSHAYFGGLYTIFRFIDGFQRRGVSNRVVIFDNADASPRVMHDKIVEAWPSLEGIEVTCGTVPGRDPLAHIPPSDIGVSTLWMSAYALARWRGVRGKYYFVQDYEPSFYPAGSANALAEQTYRFGFTGIVNTPGLSEAYAAHGNPAIPFCPAVDRSVYRPGTQSSDDEVLRIVFYGRPSVDRNAFGLGLAALTKVKQRFGDRVDIVSVGEAWDPHEFGLQGIVRSAGLLPGLEAVAELYRSAHIGLVLMFSKHPSYQPFEYMASGCATVTNQNDSTDWLFDDGANVALSVPTASAIADRIAQLIDDPEARARIVEGGLATVDALDWEREIERVYSTMVNERVLAEV